MRSHAGLNVIFRLVLSGSSPASIAAARREKPLRCGDRARCSGTVGSKMPDSCTARWCAGTQRRSPSRSPFRSRWISRASLQEPLGEAPVVRPRDRAAGVLVACKVILWSHGAVTHEREVVRVVVVPDPSVPQERSVHGQVERGRVGVLEQPAPAGAGVKCAQ